MLKLATLVLSMLVIFPAWSHVQYPYKLFKLYPQSPEQVDILKKYAVAVLAEGASNSSRWGGFPPIFLTPLGVFKTAYILVPGEDSIDVLIDLNTWHVPYKSVDIVTLKRSDLNYDMHQPAELPPKIPSRLGTPIVISSPRVTNFGEWGAWVNCPDGQYVVGMQLRTDHSKGSGDDTSLNAITLICAEPGSYDYTDIHSLEGRFGNWSEEYFCPDSSQVTGFQLRSEADNLSVDLTGASNLRVFCSSGQMLEGDGLDYGDWTERQKCLHGQAVTGFRTQVEPEVGGGGDDTSLNNIDMLCNELPKMGMSTKSKY